MKEEKGNRRSHQSITTSKRADSVVVVVVNIIVVVKNFRPSCRDERLCAEDKVDVDVYIPKKKGQGALEKGSAYLSKRFVFCPE